MSRNEAQRDALVGLLWATLRIVGVVDGATLDQATAFLRQALNPQESRVPLALDVLLQHLLAAGIAPPIAEQVVAYLHFKRAEFGIPMRLPETIEHTSIMVRRKMVEEIERKFATRLGDNENDLFENTVHDLTPVVSMHRLAVPDPTRRLPALLVLSGPAAGRFFRLDKPRHIIGRAPTVDIVIQDDGMSRRHAEIRQSDHGLEIRDLGSRNGLIINGFGVNEHLLQDGDRIQLGSTTVLKFSYPDELEEQFQAELYKTVTQDPLTDIYNKRFFLDRFRIECVFSRRHKSPLSFMIIDLDQFKKINANFGNLTGDIVLQDTALLIQSKLRSEDMIGRYSGTTFAAFLRNTEAADALIVAERIRHTIQQHPFHHENNVIEVTVSIGIVESTQSNTFDDTILIKNALESLEKAKAKGRNCVHCWP